MKNAALFSILLARFRVLSTIIGVVLILAGCARETPISQNSAASNPTASISPDGAGVSRSSAQALFQDVAVQSGLKWQQETGSTGKLYFVELTPSGCAFFDFDNDGFLDVFLVQAGSVALPSTVKNRAHCALYRNHRDGTFVEVTMGSGLDKDLGYAQGVAVGDYDNDGFDDLFITAYGGNHLFRNLRGSGQFEDVTKKLGLAAIHGTGYATSAAWGDYDNDGRLDLFVCYYTNWSHALDKKCIDRETNTQDYCHPQLYEPVTQRLFHNSAQGFVDVSEKAGIVKTKGRGLAVAWTDYNRDGKPDIFVANDVTPSMLWRNNGDGTFSDVAAQMGVAFDGRGQTLAGMGIAIADYDHSGAQSLYISNYSSQPNIVFKNNAGTFEDVTAAARLSTSHLKFLSFGCEFFDYDADGWPDIITNNGHVQKNSARRGVDVPYLQRKQLLHNKGRGKFKEIVDPQLLGDLSLPTQGRGLAVGDYDNDGHLDILAVSQGAPVQLFHNNAHNSNHWVSFQAIGTKSNRDGVHARFEIKDEAMQQQATVHGGSSYLSSSDRRIYFGVGAATKIEQVVVTWPSGQRDVLKNLPVDTFYTVTEGRGVTRQAAPTKR